LDIHTEPHSDPVPNCCVGLIISIISIISVIATPSRKRVLFSMLLLVWLVNAVATCLLCVPLLPATAIEYPYDYHEISLLYPRHGETYVSRRTEPSIKMCYYFSVSNRSLAHITDSKQYLLVAGIAGVDTGSLTVPFTVQGNQWHNPHMCVNYTYNGPLVPQSVEIRYVPGRGAAEVVVASYNMVLLVVGESDIVLPSVVMPNAAANEPTFGKGSFIDKLDFVEIGTSDFETCIISAKLACDSNHSKLFSCPIIDFKSLRGISVDPVRHYLERK
jgi:hypothetical protein